MSESRIFQIVGLSKSGKTSLILDLINYLKDTKLSISVIKSARNHYYQKNEKDSERFLERGATSSSVVFSNLTQVSINQSYSLEEAISSIKIVNKPSIILVEGFKTEDYDKILIWSEELEKYLDLFNLINLKLVYCKEDIYIENRNKIQSFADKLGVEISSKIEDIVSIIVTEP